MRSLNFRLRWLEYFGFKYGKVTVAVPPHNTSQNCFNCGKKVKKSLSTRTNICPDCNYVEDRDVNAAKNILQLGLSTAGHVGTHTLGRQCGECSAVLGFPQVEQLPNPEGLAVRPRATCGRQRKRIEMLVLQ